MFLPVAPSVGCGGTEAPASPAAPANPIAAAPMSSAQTPTEAPAKSASTSVAEPRALTVFAASSLTNVFDQMWAAFKAQAGNEGITITPNYGSSSQLRTQLQEGAKADLFASADVAQMDQAAKAGLLDGDATTFARNRLVVIVPKGNPGKVTTLADLARPGLKFVTTPADVPIGAYTRTALKKLGADPSLPDGYDSKVLANIVSEEANVRQAVVKVQIGEADAGICYATDVTAVPAGEVTVIDIPDAANVVAEYPIAVLKSAKAPATARRLIAFITSAPGRTLLEAAKFGPA
jgi:molybdate transport system substrate-binding protein